MSDILIDSQAVDEMARGRGLKPMTIFEHALARTQPIHFWHSREQIETWSASDLLGKAKSVAVQMRDRGVGPGDVVALMLDTSADLIACLLAVWGCRATVCIMPHKTGGESGRLSHTRLKAILELLKPKLVVMEQAEPEAFEQIMVERLTRGQLANTPGAQFPDMPKAEDIALIQLTSGSTSLPKGVVLRHHQVLANVEAILDKVGYDKTDHVVSWLPINHDMGLSCVTFPILSNISVTLISSERFARSPTIWLEALSQQCGTMSPSPNFAYALLPKFVRRLEKAAINLSSWRYAWVGAEPVQADYLQAFETAMRPFGLQANVLQPAYGLAEAVVAVAMGKAGSAYRVLCVDRQALQEKGLVKIIKADSEHPLKLVSNGHPVNGVSVSVRSPAGAVLKEDTIGHIWISGESVTTGYLEGVSAENFADGWFDTGDLGFIHNGELYISGRAKDVIIRGGVNISPAHVEWAVEQLLELRPGQVAAFSHVSPRNSEEVALIIGMRAPSEEQPDLVRRVAVTVANEVGLQIDHILFISPGQIPKTTSGKVQRGTARKMFLDRIFEEQA